MKTRLPTKLSPRLVRDNMKDMTPKEVIALFDEYKRGEWRFSQ